MKKPQPTGRAAPKGPTQRQLRAGELVRHALVDIFREEEINDPVLAGVSVTVTEVRVGPDLRHAQVRWGLPTAPAGTARFAVRTAVR